MLCPGLAGSAEAGFAVEIKKRVIRAEVKTDRKRIIALLN
jgi:hypothetical protein